MSQDLEQFFTVRAQANEFGEANAYPTVAGGYYKFQAKGYENATKQGEARLSVKIKGDLFKDEKRIGSVNVYMSPQMERGTTGKPDRSFKLYTQFVRQLFPELKTDLEYAEVDLGTLLQRVVQFPVGAKVTETFKSPSVDPATGKYSYKDALSQDEAKALRTEGWKANNYVQAIGKVE